MGRGGSGAFSAPEFGSPLCPFVCPRVQATPGAPAFWPCVLGTSPLGPRFPGLRSGSGGGTVGSQSEPAVRGALQKQHLTERKRNPPRSHKPCPWRQEGRCLVRQCAHTAEPCGPRSGLVGGGAPLKQRLRPHPGEGCPALEWAGLGPLVVPLGPGSLGSLGARPQRPSVALYSSPSTGFKTRGAAGTGMSCCLSKAEPRAGQGQAGP